MNVYNRLLKYVVPYRKSIVTACLFTLGYTLAHSLVSVTVFLVLNGIQNKSQVVLHSMNAPEWFAKLNLPTFEIPSFSFSTRLIPLIVIGVFLMRGIFEYASRYQMSIVGLRVIRQVRDDLYAHLIRLSSRFYSKGRTGELMSRTMHDVSVIQGGITDVFVDLFKQPLVILFQIPLVFFWGGPLAFIALAVFPVVLVPLVLLGHKLRRTHKKVQEQIGHIHSKMQETFTGINVVKAFNMERYEVKKFEGDNKQVYRFLKRTVIITTAQRPIIEIMGSIGIAVTIWYGIKVLPLDRFASFLTCLFLFYEPLKKLSKVNSTVQQAMAAGTRIFELMDRTPEIRDHDGAQPLEEPICSIEFSHISLAYEPEKYVLRDVDLNVRGNEVVAIVGSSGSGKTSLVNLIPRLYDVTDGALKINGMDIRDYKLTSLRSKVGIVTQETFLFNATVFENIAYGRLESSFDEIKAAAKAAYADEFIRSLAKGYSTVIGERGVTLSGGQRQRLAIARALLKNPPILILDEATSQLDTESEREVQRALERLIENRTVFVIAHRLSTVQNANRIIVLDQGKIVEVGDNHSLIEEGGIYKRLHDLQFNL